MTKSRLILKNIDVYVFSFLYLGTYHIIIILFFVLFYSFFFNLILSHITSWNLSTVCDDSHKGSFFEFPYILVFWTFGPKLHKDSNVLKHRLLLNYHSLPFYYSYSFLCSFVTHILLFLFSVLLGSWINFLGLSCTCCDANSWMEVVNSTFHHSRCNFYHFMQGMNGIVLQSLPFISFYILLVYWSLSLPVY